MNGPSALSHATSENRMLAISMPPPAPHLLSRRDPLNSLSMLPSEGGQPHSSLLSGTRPKLSLKTTSLAPTFHGSTAHSNGSDTNATATPTTYNTFNNTFDLTYRPSPVSTLPSPAPHQRPSVQTSSPVSRASDQPYRLILPFSVRPILKNSPLPPDARPASISASPRVPGRRVFFPAPKKVTFRLELEDEIVTKQYVARSVDLSSSDDETTPSESDEQSGSSNDEEKNEVKEPSIRVDEVSVRGRRKRKSSAVSPSPATEAGRGREERSQSTSTRRSKRKRRRWEWTLDAKTSDRVAAEAKAGDVQEYQTAKADEGTPA